MNRYRFILEDIREDDNPSIIAGGVIVNSGGLEYATKWLQEKLPTILINVNERDGERYQPSDVHLMVKPLEEWIISQIEHTYDLLKAPDSDDD